MTAPAERQRRASNRDKLISHLLAYGSASNVELAQIAGLRFGARLLELRRQGWCVETQEIGRGLVKYVLTRPTPLADGQQELFR